MPDSPITYDVLFRCEAADGLAGELAAEGGATVIADGLVAIAARFTAEHTTGVRFSVPELEEPETEGPYPAPNAEMAVEEVLRRKIEDEKAVDAVYRAAREFCGTWEGEPRKIEALHSVAVQEAFDALWAAAQMLRGIEPVWQEITPL
jgi:hypothetical protein